MAVTDPRTIRNPILQEGRAPVYREDRDHFNRGIHAAHSDETGRSPPHAVAAASQ